MLGNKLGERKTLYVPDYVVFDLETTGISAARDQVVEISAVKVERGQVVEEFSTLVNPQMPIPFYASQVNGITDQMVVASPLFAEALAGFLDFAGDSVLVGHNIHSFDMKFIWRDARKFWNKIPGNDYIDTLHMARMCLPQLGHHKLVDLAAYYGISPEGAHRALNDCRMNQQVYEMMGRELERMELAKKGVSNSVELRKCPHCGGLLKKRSGRFGEFFGCENFPTCRYTENVKR